MPQSTQERPISFEETVQAMQHFSNMVLMVKQLDGLMPDPDGMVARSITESEAFLARAFKELSTPPQQPGTESHSLPDTISVSCQGDQVECRLGDDLISRCAADDSSGVSILVQTAESLAQTLRLGMDIRLPHSVAADLHNDPLAISVPSPTPPHSNQMV